MNDSNKQSNPEVSPFVKNRKTLALFLLGVFAVYSVVTGNLPIFRLYTAAPINGTIVDAKTKKPLSDVVVVASWELNRANLHGTTDLGPLWLYETVTDTNGHYSIPAQFVKLAPAASYFGTRDPVLYLFKPTYLPTIKKNPIIESRLSWSDKELYRRSQWDNKTIALEKPSKKYIQRYRSADHAHYFSVMSFSSGLKRGILYASTCHWESIPKMITALDTDLIQLERSGYLHKGVIPPSTQTIKVSMKSKYHRSGCKDPESILRY